MMINTKINNKLNNDLKNIMRRVNLWRIYANLLSYEPARLLLLLRGAQIHLKTLFSQVAFDTTHHGDMIHNNIFSTK